MRSTERAVLYASPQPLHEGTIDNVLYTVDLMAPFVSTEKDTRLCITADRDSFDSSFLRSWSLEGFDVRYVPLVKDQKAFIRDLEGVKTGLSVSESYAIISVYYNPFKNQ